MIVVTGGAGFIGSAIVWRLNQRNITDILIVDHLGEDERWKNLVALKYQDYLDKSVFIEKLEAGDFRSSISAIFHMGACSSTTEKNADYLIDNNYKYTIRLGLWQEQNPYCRFIYASSAATYGNGEHGYEDLEDYLHFLTPLNMYAYSKHLFDLMALRKGWLKNIVGLKYFNVFGPNEYHKEDMRSVVNKAFYSIKKEGKIKLFKSYNSNYKDGEQLRDFIYVKDAVNMTLFFLENPNVNGIFNIGTGNPRTWNDLATAIFKALKKRVNIEYISMPTELINKYQYYTCASMSKLAFNKCSYECMSLEASIKEYVTEYLTPNYYLGS